ncbi:serine hydrolase [Algibacter sp. 2305UL17-15]|uniref:serine hydrolase n=1 Tax=Algibacter sp. 2305UL17-15 TaxID=3231268 RepID=UPI00345B2DB2
MKKTLLLLIIPCFLFGQTGINVPEMTHCDTQMINFLNSFGIPGATFAISVNGRMVYSRAFGNANMTSTEVTRPYHLFRVASLSKPITSIGIMKMIDDGFLNLNDKVFGTGGILENHWYFSNITITDARYDDITVQMLLEHTSGWDRNINCFPNPTSPYPWFFSGCDPIVAPLQATQVLGESNPAKEEHLISFLLKQNLNHEPGTVYSYSNMGFLVLSEVIEEISGMTYEAWMQQEIFNPLGIYDMHIGKNLLANKREREGEYIGEGFTTLSQYNDGTVVPWEYGGFSVEIMDGHGGWISTSRDLVRFLLAADGFSTKPDILSSTAINTMSTPSSANNFYAKGWQVNSANNWWHSGALSGTASYLVRTSGGATWAIVLNKRLTDSNANAFWSQLDAMGWNCIGGTTTFPTHDLLDAPTLNATNLQATNITGNSMDLSWQNGNGTSRIVVAKDISSSTNSFDFEAYPIDGMDYVANNDFTSGDDLGDGTFVIYNGTGNSVSLANLSETTNYAIRIYEYKKLGNNGNNALYLLGGAEQLVQATTILNINENDLSNHINVYPTVVNTAFNIDIRESKIGTYNFYLYNINGVLIKRGILENSQNKLNLEHLNSGIYILKISENHIKENAFKIIKI